MSIVSGIQLLPLNVALPFRANFYHHIHNTITPFNPRNNLRNSLKLSVKLDNSTRPSNSEQELNLSVLRFTFGIPGFDESYLPRWIGYGFGSLIIVNHFFGSNSNVTSAQLVSEALGLSLAVFSITIPFVGRFLKGAMPEGLITLPQSAQQIFVMSPVNSDILKEDLAWTTYILLRNTKSFSVLIYVQGVICVRGYWNIPEKLSKDETLNWFLDKINKSGLPEVEETLNFSQRTGSVLEKAIPEEMSSILIQPLCTENRQSKEKKNMAGFVLVASSISYAYDEKDLSWIKAMANKFDKGEVLNTVS